MKIGILGAGNVGGALGKGWARQGHQVVFGVRNTSDRKVAAVYDAKRHSFSGESERENCVDCTNPLKDDLSGLEIGFNTSAAEQVQSWASGARLVKVFNTTGSNNMENPRYSEGLAAMFYCGDDAQAKSAAKTLAADLGFDPIDAGPLRIARLLEPYAMLWIIWRTDKRWAGILLSA
jgi:predicted dinucleotide-binding enzyme